MTRPLTLIECRDMARRAADARRKRIRAMMKAGPVGYVAMRANGRPQAVFTGHNAAKRCKSWGRGLDYLGIDLEVQVVPLNPKE